MKYRSFSCFKLSSATFFSSLIILKRKFQLWAPRNQLLIIGKDPRSSSHEKNLSHILLQIEGEWLWQHPLQQSQTVPQINFWIGKGLWRDTEDTATRLPLQVHQENNRYQVFLWKYINRRKGEKGIPDSRNGLQCIFGFGDARDTGIQCLII